MAATVIRLTPLLLLVVGLGGCVSRVPEPVAEIRPGLLAGYLQEDAYPDSLGLLPAPPAADAAAAQQDRALNQAALALRGSARFELAAVDNDLSFPAAAGTFSCALGAPVDEARTPFLYQLLRRALVDAGLATYRAKTHYQRQRPFLVNGQATCVDQETEQRLAEDGSYPSGHSAIGWAWALILTELAPDRMDRILARGRAFGDSRWVCNVHWPSDVAAGRAVGAAVVARLHADPRFRADLARAAAELIAVRAAAAPPLRDCAAERAALEG